MLLKLGIIASIVIIGGIIFSAEIQEIFPNSSTTGVNSLKTDVKLIASESIDSAEQKIDSTVEKAETKLSDFGHQTIQKAENKIDQSVEKTENQISEIKQESSEYVEETITEKLPFLNSDK